MMQKSKDFGFKVLALLIAGAALGLNAPAMAKSAAAPKKQPSVADEVYDDYYSDSTEVNDPLETINRGIFKFNEAVDFILLKPIARTYVFIVPEAGRTGVHNVLSNLGEPVNALNGFLQGNPERGFTSLWRFILNSTLGVAGIFDFAGANTDLKYVQEDFGQTLAVYGSGTGPYIVLPIIGPSSGRDTAGLVVDALTNPFNHLDNDKLVYGRLALNVIDARARNLDLVDDIYANSLDPYATFRSAYLQRREALVNNQRVPDTLGGADDAQ